MELRELVTEWRKYVHDMPPIDSFGNGHNTARKQDADELEASLAAHPVVALADLQEALKACLGEPIGIHQFLSRRKGTGQTCP